MMLKKGALLLFKVIRQISRSHGYFFFDVDPNWAFPDCNSSLNSPIAMKWCTKLEAAYERPYIVFQGHPSIFKVTQDKKIANFDPNWAIPDCNSSLTSLMDLKWYTKLDVVLKGCPLVFQGHPSIFKIKGTKKSALFTRVSVSALYLQFEFTDGFEMMHKACNYHVWICCCLLWYVPRKKKTLWWVIIISR